MDRGLEVSIITPDNACVGGHVEQQRVSKNNIAITCGNSELRICGSFCVFTIFIWRINILYVCDVKTGDIADSFIEISTRCLKENEEVCWMI